MVKKVLQSPRPPTEVPNARHWKQPKGVPSGSRYSSRKTAGKTAETPEKQLFWLFLGCFFFRVFRLFSGCFSAALPRPTRHPFRLFFGCFQCQAFGTSVGGRGDCKESAEKCWEVLRIGPPLSVTPLPLSKTRTCLSCATGSPVSRQQPGRVSWS